MMKALYIPCYSGELGWELINYVPYVNYICSKNNFSEVHAVVREGREVLYPMSTHVYPIKLSDSKSMGNNGPSPPKNNIIKQLKSTFEVKEIASPKGGCKYIKHRKYLKYEAEPDSLWKWRHIPDDAVTCCVRRRSFGSHKNWKDKHWSALCEFLLKNGMTPVITGLVDLVKFKLPSGCIDAQNRTTMSDLLAILQKSRFAVGQSTGPMHFSSLAGVPHVAWGTSRIQDRYLKSWNPHKTPVEYLVCKQGFQCSPEEVHPLILKMIERTK